MCIRDRCLARCRKRLYRLLPKTESRTHHRTHPRHRRTPHHRHTHLSEPRHHTSGTPRATSRSRQAPDTNTQTRLSPILPPRNAHQNHRNPYETLRRHHQNTPPQRTPPAPRIAHTLSTKPRRNVIVKPKNMQAVGQQTTAWKTYLRNL